VPAVETLGVPDRADGPDPAIEADRLQSLIDGLALHAALRPGSLPPQRLVAILRAHLDELDGSRSGRR
jgi:hypothetical protein